MPETKVQICPSCQGQLEKAEIKGRRNIYRCAKEDKLYRLSKPRRPRSSFKADDPSTWRATCIECGYKGMKYYNYAYCCDKCGHILQV